MALLSGISASVGAGLNQGYAQSGYTNGSVNSAQSSNNSYNEASNENWSRSASGTDATTARNWSALQAELAWQRDMDAMQMQMDFNREEAEKQRKWQADMANTIYTRSVKNMKEAGINPILAAGMGLSGASVGSGATASLGGIPSAPLAQSFMDSWSSSEAYGHGSSMGYGNGESWGNGSSWGSGWSNSEEGIVTALQALGGMAGSALEGINSANVLEQLNKKVGGSEATEWGYNVGQQIRNKIGHTVESITEKIAEKANKSNFTSTGGGHAFKK